MRMKSLVALTIEASPCLDDQVSAAIAQSERNSTSITARPLFVRSSTH
jgi:hypothetical protein